MSNRWLVVAAAVALGAGCRSNSSEMANLSVGMPKAEVLRILGRPIYASSAGGVERLVFRLKDPDWDQIDEYFVQFKAGKVDGYGKQGKSDAGKPAESTPDSNVPDQNAPTPPSR